MGTDEVVVDEQGRREPPLAAGEVDTLLGFLDFQRQTLEWKTRGLDGAGLSATLPPSTMTLGGLLKHLAWVEDHWFAHRLHGLERHRSWLGVDPAAEPDWEWTSAAGDTPEALRELWSGAVDRSRRLAAAVLETTGPDTPEQRGSVHGTVSLRWILVHMIEEYARHNGHADLLREAVDGAVGE